MDTGAKNTLTQRWSAPRVRQKASPASPMGHARVQRLLEHTPLWQSPPLLQAAPKAAVPGGASQWKQRRGRMAPASFTPASGPPPHTKGPPQDWPAAHSSARLHSPMSRTEGARQVPASQYPPP
ncbi:MAG: hypothetical protein IPF99_38795 [Deltaproteobacteria bacterium]|nr:hypothetical protein [Deltaproteobacteria bacterium]